MKLLRNAKTILIVSATSQHRLIIADLKIDLMRKQKKTFQRKVKVWRLVKVNKGLEDPQREFKERLVAENSKEKDADSMCVCVCGGEIKDAPLNLQKRIFSIDKISQISFSATVKQSVEKMRKLSL